MAKFESRHQEDDERDNAQIVGKRDLRDSLKEFGTIKGSFSINGFEFTNFQAGSGPAVVDAINRSTNQTGVTASINEDGNLVLDNNDPEDIVISLGKVFDEPPATSGSVADEVVNKLKAEDEARKRDGKGPQNHVLEALGLDGFATDAADPASVTNSPDSPAYTGKAPAGSGGDRVHAGQTNNPSQNPTAPVVDSGGQGQGKMADGRGRTGSGEGYHTKPDGTPPVRGTPNNPDGHGGGGNPAAEGNPGGEK